MIPDFLLNLLLCSTLWLGAGWLLVRLFAPGAQRREWIWKTATLGALLTPLLQFWTPAPSLSLLPAPSSEADAAAPAPAWVLVAPEPYSKAGRSTPWQEELARAGVAGMELPSATSFLPRAEARLQAQAQAQEAEVAESSFPWRSGLLWAWAVVAGLLLGRMLLRHFAWRRQLRDRMELTTGALAEELRPMLEAHRVRLSVSDRLAVPVAFGCLYGEICLPVRALRELEGPQLRSMVGHELAHLRRRDPLWILGFQFLQAVFFFQPLWLLARRGTMHAAEELCDAWSGEQVGNRFAMAECLTRVADWLKPGQRELPVACMADRSSPLKRRVARLLDSNPERPLRSHRAFLLAVATLSCVSFAMPRITATPLPEDGRGAGRTLESAHGRDLLTAELDLAHAGIEALRQEIDLLEGDLLDLDPALRGDAVVQTLERLRRKLDALEQLTQQIEGELPNTIE